MHKVVAMKIETEDIPEIPGKIIRPDLERLYYMIRKRIELRSEQEIDVRPIIINYIEIQQNIVEEHIRTKNVILLQLIKELNVRQLAAEQLLCPLLTRKQMIAYQKINFEIIELTIEMFRELKRSFDAGV
ncbi:MAG: hypothetical protein K9L30_11455 [Desulfobacterales bacterium]|nr:hypothetical protein [Desulfobacterales bacterium]